MFRRFMYGRYGNDQLNTALLIASIVFGLISVPLSGVWDLALSLLQLACLAVWMLRAFSRNQYKRRIENDKFLRLRGRLKKPLSKLKSRFSCVGGFFKRLADREHKYFKCPSCKTRLRVPRGRGVITVTCPLCKNKFDKKS